jgi:hypothetical protein
MELMQLIYASDKVTKDDSELAAIMASAARNNRKNQVTGMLLYAGGNFMQVIEGAPATVRDTYARIAQDTRHRNLLLMLEEPVEQRHFSEWSMGFKRLGAEHAKAFPQFAPYFQYGLDARAIQAMPGCALDMLQTFSKGMQ